MIAIVPKYAKVGEGYPRRAATSSGADPGRPWNRPAGGWVDDLVGLQKLVMLCDLCVSKFNPRRNHYEPWRRGLYAIAKCDGCNQTGYRTKLFIHESTHDQVGDPGQIDRTKTKRKGWWRR